MREIKVPVEPLDRTAFAPFGLLLEAPLAPASYSRPNLDLWRLPFSADAPTRLQIMRYRFQPMRFSRLERHLAVTEARFASGATAVLVVAGDATSPGREDPPSPDTLRAFLIGGSAGILFRPGVWHGLDCYPAAPPHADFLFLSDEQTETEIESQSRPVSGIRTEVVDYRERDGIVFAVSDPGDLLAG